MSERRKIIKRTALIGKPGTSSAWQEVETFDGLPPGTSICIGYITPHGTTGHSYGIHRPKRRKGESPVAYYRRTKVVPDDFLKRHNGWYYCNPYHCKHRWRSKKERDKHMDAAYALLA